MHWLQPVRASSVSTGVRPLEAEVLGRADVVFHLAGRAGVRDDGPDVEAARRRDNVLAPSTVLALNPPDPRLLVTSFSSAYGGVCTVGGVAIPSREDGPRDPRCGYARSRVLVEERCLVRRARGGDVTVVRPFTVTGPGHPPTWP